jgi:small-conductance mechanosensitive channel/CRP-like cAMP-binding protein
VSLVRSLLKIVGLCLVPSALLVAALELFATQLGVPQTFLTTFLKIAWSCLWVSVGLLGIAVVSQWLSPERARRRGRIEPPHLLRDLVRYGLFIVCVAMVLRFVWGEDVSPLIGALGVGGVVLGFALQETLNNFFAGLALLLEKPFAQGDWIKIGEKVEGAVEHMTWRATKIRTRDSDYQIFPNSMVAKEVIVNFRQPTRLHAIRLPIGTSYDDPPDLVKRTLVEIAASVPEVAREPAPIVYLRAYADFSINYELKCFIEDYDRRPLIEDELLHRIWYVFRRVGIEIPFPIQTSYEYKMSLAALSTKGAVDVERVLAQVPIFAPLQPEELKQLAALARVVRYARGEAIIRQGETGDTLFAIASGAARVAVRGEGGLEKTVATLPAGEVFGEMSLLTGDPRAASVHAEDGLVLVSVSREALLPVLTANPGVAEKMAEVVTLRKQGLERAQAEVSSESGKRADVQAAKATLAGRIRRFFRLGSRA